MRRSGFMALVLLSGVFTFPALHFATAGTPTTQSGFSDSEERRIETIVREYLLKHPEVIVEAMQELDRKQASADKLRQDKAIAANRAAIYDDADSFVAGNPKGDVTIVEFFDYQCGYCKHSFEPLMDTVKNDGNIRLILKEFPILSPESATASHAAIASMRQGKYLEFHKALFHHKGALTDDEIMRVASSVGLDTARLKRDMADPKIGAILKRNYELADALGVKGTPGFIVGGKLIPGALEKDEFAAVVKDARETCGANC